MTRILGVDPGLRHCGWGMIAHDRGQLSYIACGTINPPAKGTLPARLLALNTQLTAIVASHRPDEIAIEETFVSVNGKSTLLLGQARGAILLTLAQAGLPVSEYAARLVKKTVTGSGSADKTQIQQMLRYLLPKSEATSADAADALAIAICHAHHQRG